MESKNNLETWSGKKALEYYDHQTVSPLEKEIFLKYFRGKVLDLGSGRGRLTHYFHEQGFEVIGIEIVKEMVELSKKRYPHINFFFGTASQLNFKNNSFDSIYFNALDFIQPTKERINALKEISRVSKKDGIIIFNLHIYNFLKPRFWLRNFFKKTIFKRYKYEKGDIGEFYVYYSLAKNHIRLIEKNTSLKFLKIVKRMPRDTCPYFIFVNRSS